MPADRVERRLADAIWAASDALRAAAHDFEEYSEERGKRGSYRRDSDRDRDRDPHGDVRGSAGDGDERCGAEAPPPLPPYPPIPAYPPFPPYPPMPPIVIVCGSECRHGAGYVAGLGHSLSAGSPLPPLGPTGAAPAPPVATQATTVHGSAAPPFQPPSGEKTPAGGISFAIGSSTPSQQPNSDA
jgi:hypothetical protein